MQLYSRLGYINAAKWTIQYINYTSISSVSSKFFGCMWANLRYPCVPNMHVALCPGTCERGELVEPGSHCLCMLSNESSPRVSGDLETSGYTIQHSKSVHDKKVYTSTCKCTYTQVYEGIHSSYTWAYSGILR